MPFRTVLPQTETGLVLYLTGNAGAGKIMHDCSPMGNNGRIYGATWVEGKFGKALKFDGVDDYVNVSHNDVFNMSNFSVVMLFNPESFTNPNSGYKGHWIYKNQYIAIITNSNGNVEVRTIDSGGAIVGLYSISLELGNWYLVAYTVSEGGEMKLYINGVLDASTTFSGPPTSNTNALRIGSAYDLNYAAKGKIDEVRIYNRVLSAEEIRAHFKGAVIKLRP